MLTRERHESNRQYSSEVLAARQELKIKGWSYRTAAPFLGVTYQQIGYVLTGKRSSNALLRRIHCLPPRRKTPIK